jgi:uncharacterized membrane protein
MDFMPKVILIILSIMIFIVINYAFYKIFNTWLMGNAKSLSKLVSFLLTLVIAIFIALYFEDKILGVKEEKEDISIMKITVSIFERGEK